LSVTKVVVAETGQLEFYRYELEPPKYTPHECEERGFTYAAPLRVTFRLVTWDVAEHTGRRTIRDIKEQDLYMGDLPLVTQGGVFIVYGTKRYLGLLPHSSLDDAKTDREDGQHAGRDGDAALTGLVEAVRHGLSELEEPIRERMGSVDLDRAMPHELINARPLVARVWAFFGALRNAPGEILSYECGYWAGCADGSWRGRRAGYGRGMRDGYQQGAAAERARLSAALTGKREALLQERYRGSRIPSFLTPT
jgi:DNA-directed RNA polymerase beta subunit